MVYKMISLFSFFFPHKSYLVVSLQGKRIFRLKMSIYKAHKVELSSFKFWGKKEIPLDTELWQEVTC